MKNLPANAGDLGLISGSVRSPGIGNDKMATHSSILAWEIPGTEEPGWALVHGVAKSWTWPAHFSVITAGIPLCSLT